MPLDWRHWYDFYQSVIVPLAEAGVEINVSIQLTAEGEMEINLIDLSVKESVLQLSPEGRVKIE